MEERKKKILEAMEVEEDLPKSYERTMIIAQLYGKEAEEWCEKIWNTRDDIELAELIGIKK